jgi:hypothetical protein
VTDPLNQLAASGFNKLFRGSGGALDGLFAGIRKLIPCAEGGSFMVSRPGGTDSQLVAFKPNERVSIETQEQQRNAAGSRSIRALR